MEISCVEKLKSVDLDKLIKNAWDFELRRECDAAIKNFEPIWADINEQPDFSGNNIDLQAILYRLTGYFLGYYGKIKNKKHYQERAKDLLMKSIRFFHRMGDTLKVAEAQNCLSMCYIHGGELAEAEIILEQTAEDFLLNKSDIVYLKNRGNLLSTKLRQQKYADVIDIVEDILIPMDFCGDRRARIVFHENAGLAFRQTSQFGKAISNYEKAMKLTEGYDLVESASIFNNLAYLYYKTDHLDSAHYHVDKAISIAQNYQLIGWLPSYFDTKALIFAKEGRSESAIELIQDAISLLQKGEDYYAITDSMWNKCKFLFQLNRKEEALIVFSDLIAIAGQKMGEFAVKNFTKGFANLIHYKQGRSLNDKVTDFKQKEIISAIQEANNNLHLAAETLKTDLSELSRILDNEFPEIYDELNLQRASETGHGLVSNNVEAILSAPRKISPLTLENIHKDYNASNLSTFFISAETTLDILGFEEDVVVAVSPIECLNSKDFVLTYNPENNQYYFGKPCYDKDLELFFINNNSEIYPISLDDKNLIGKVIGYMPFAEINSENLVLCPLSF
jgi:tetratricopeptide (TPR) repeat protein